MGDTVAEDLPVGVERRYGDEIMQEVWKDPAFLDDSILEEYLQSLWAPMLAAARQRGDIEDDLWTQFAWKTFLVQDRSVNAFALPGGYVGVHLGLIAMTSSRDELASVLAHELSHVSQRHIARSMASANRQGTASLAAMLLGMIVAARARSPDMAQAAIAGSQAAAIQGQLNFSRDMEREADRIGFGIFSDAGFGASGMATMFEKLEQAGRLNDNGALPYLRTHPLTAERVSEARARLAPSAMSARAPDVWHGLMQARARVLMETDEPALQRARDAADASALGTKAPGVLYAAVLAAMRQRDAAAADRYLSMLRTVADRLPTGDRTAFDRSVRMLAAEAALSRGAARAAIELVRPLAGAAPSRAALALWASAALQARDGEPEDRALDEALREWLSRHADDAALWTAHGRLAEVWGRRLQAMRAQAEARAAQGDLAAAIDRLRAAQRASRGATGAELVDASIIDARLRDLEQRHRALTRPTRTTSSPPG